MVNFFFCALSIRPLIVPPTWVYPAARCGGALAHVCTCRQIHLYGEPKKSTHHHQTHLAAHTHQSKTASDEAVWEGGCRHRRCCSACMPTAAALLSLAFLLPSHSPSDMCLPRSTPWVGPGARLRVPTNSFVWQIQKIDSRPPNSSPGTHAPAALRLQLIPTTTPARQACTPEGRKKARVSILL